MKGGVQGKYSVNGTHTCLPVLPGLERIPGVEQRGLSRGRHAPICGDRLSSAVGRILPGSPGAA